MAALRTEVCLAFPTLDALRDGYEVFPVVDAVGGTSPEARRAGLERIVPSRRPTDRMGVARRRAGARLGTNRHGSERRGHRAHIPTSEGILSGVQLRGAGEDSPNDGQSLF